MLDPLRRARAILRVCGESAKEEETVLDPELLDEVMAAREAVERAEGVEEVARWHRDTEGKVDAVVGEVGGALRRGEWVSARTGVAKLTYLMRLREVIRDKG